MGREGLVQRDTEVQSRVRVAAVTAAEPGQKRPTRRRNAILGALSHANDSLHPLLPTNPTFAGHQTFAFRSSWLKKGIDALATPGFDARDVFGTDEALAILGVGKNMVGSIRHWLTATRMAEDASDRGDRRLTPTALGSAVFGSIRGKRSGWDPFLEDLATLWLIHWQLVSYGSLVFTWAWTFNYFREYEFSRDSLADSLLRAAAGRAPRVPSRATVLRDADCLLRTYVRGDDGSDSEETFDCPLAELQLIRPAFHGHFAFTIGPKLDLPMAVFCYAMISYWAARHWESAALSIHELAYGEGSPGFGFKLDIETVSSYLDQIEEATDGALVFTDSSQGQQVSRSGKAELPDPMGFLKRYYEENHS